MSDEITKRQREILDVLWSRGEATSGDICSALPDAPTASTVRSLLQIMAERGLIVDDGSTYRKRYRAGLSREEVDGDALPKLLERHYSGSVDALLDELIERDLLDIETLERRVKAPSGADVFLATDPEDPVVTPSRHSSKRGPQPSAGTLIAGGVAFGIGLLLGRR